MAGNVALRLVWRGLVIIVLCAGMALGPVQPAYATAYTVNSLADTNDGHCNVDNCTLREAITAAMVGAADDTISFSVDGTITLGSVLPSIMPTGGDLTIDGAGHTITISGNDAVRVFYVASGASLTLQNLTLTHGRTENHDGGGVENNGTLRVTGCTFSYNVAGYSGGAIANSGTLTVTDTTFTNNGTGFYSGGGVNNRNGATATITGSSFLVNRAEVGGAIHNIGSLNVRDCTFGFNTAGSRGGAIANESSDPVRIEDSVLSFNTATFEGGAIHLSSGDYTVYIQDCVLEFNQAPEGGAVYGSGPGTTLFIRESKLSENDASYGGGVYLGDVFTNSLVSLEGSEISHNQAENDGGGVYLYQGRLSADRTTFESNTAVRDGGGVYIGINTNWAEISGSTFYDNFASRDGGGVWNDNNFSLEITNSTFVDNGAHDQGGGMYDAGFTDLLNCTFSGNQAASGGGVYAGVSLHIKNTILANSVAGGNCGYLGTPSQNSGNNIDSGTTCGFGSANGSMSNTNPQLDILRWNGGPVRSMALLEGSPAIDGVGWNEPNDCPETDQHGIPRPFGPLCDIGAFEQGFYIYMPLSIR
jgi:CSLREA domain-containing protein